MYINNSLRRGKLIDSEEDKALLKALDKVTSQTLGDSLTLYRSVDASAFFKGLTDNEYEALVSHLGYGINDNLIQRTANTAMNKLQKEVMDKGFVSTTKSKDVAEGWGGFTGAEHPIVIKIKTSSNTKGYDMKEFDMESDKQYEVLLGRNQKFKIHRVYGKNGRIYIDAQV